jgi:hypothetical protein
MTGFKSRGGAYGIIGIAVSGPGFWFIRTNRTGEDNLFGRVGGGGMCEKTTGPRTKVGCGVFLLRSRGSFVCA